MPPLGDGGGRGAVCHYCYDFSSVWNVGTNFSVIHSSTAEMYVLYLVVDRYVDHVYNS